MSPLQWKDSPESKNNSVFPAATFGNPWFTVTIGLVGIIVGYTLGTMPGAQGMIGNAAPSPTVVQVPSPAAPSAPTAPAAPVGNVPPVDLKKDHIRGNPKAEIAVIEYSDFQCPFCTKVHATYKEILQKYGDKVMWVYRHYPLSFHPNAEPAAQASECAAEIGGNDAFWKFADALFEGGSFDYAAIAKNIGLDEAKFSACIASGKYKALVQEQMTSGGAAGVSGTPGNFVMNMKTKKAQSVSGAQPFASFQSAIDAMMAAK